ncbi:hypothetical protein EDB19DRAFT_1909420 [Suillus lakei]|nr:hypothetical protein EDB19DRAFT_1909420 [Suillus lakei]
MSGLQYLYVLTATFWTYDYACSLHEEWTFLLRSRWSKVKGLYVIARYVPFVLIIADLCLIFAPNENPKKCRILSNIYACFGVISLTCSECFFILRTYVLWTKNRIVLVGMLSTLFAIIVASIGICFTAITTSDVTTSAIPGITGCDQSSHNVQFFMPFVFLFVFQVGLISLTLIPVIQSWRMAKGPLHAALVKHNILYYGCAVNVFMPLIFPDVRKPPNTLQYDRVVDVPHTQSINYTALEDFQVFVLAILATRMHLHLWHMDQDVRHSDTLVWISVDHVSPADRTV